MFGYLEFFQHEPPPEPVIDPAGTDINVAIEPRDADAIVPELLRLSQRLSVLEKTVAGKKDVAQLAESMRAAQSESDEIEARLVEKFIKSQETLAANIEKRFVIVERELNEIKRDQIDILKTLQSREAGQSKGR